MNAIFAVLLLSLSLLLSNFLPSDDDDDDDDDDNDGPVTIEINSNDQVVAIPSALYKVSSSLSSYETVDLPPPSTITTDADVKKSTVCFLSSSSNQITAPPTTANNIYGNDDGNEPVAFGINPNGQAAAAAMRSKQTDISATSSSNDAVIVHTDSDKSTNLAKSIQLAKPAKRKTRNLKSHCQEGIYWEIKTPGEEAENQGRTLRKRRAKLTSQATAPVATISAKANKVNECHDDDSIDTGSFDCIYYEREIGDERGLKCHQPICCTKSVSAKSSPIATSMVKPNNQNDDANTGNSTLMVICSEPLYQVLGFYPYCT